MVVTAGGTKLPSAQREISGSFSTIHGFLPRSSAPTAEGRRSPALPAAAYNRAVRSLTRILLLALAILAPMIASPAAPSYAETRVWGFELEEPARARAQPTLSETCIEGYPSAYDGLMVGCSPVPRGIPAARTTISPEDLNFSQRTVSGNVRLYVDDMKRGDWDWERSGPLRVMERDGQLVSYDNRRLRAAQEAGLRDVPIEIVNPDDLMPGSKITWDEAYRRRFSDPRNVRAGGAVPNGGLKEQPTIAAPRRRQ